MFYYFRVSKGTLSPIPMSNFSSKNMVKDRFVVQFIADCCDSTEETTIDYNYADDGKHRYWVRLDNKGKPVPSTLIVGKLGVNYPNMQQVRTFNCCAPSFPPPTITSVTPSNAASSIAFSPVAGATDYNYELSGNSTFTDLQEVGNTSMSPVEFSGLINGTMYYFRIQSVAADASVSNWSGTQTFTPVIGTLAAPTALAPTSITNTGASITWTAAANATSYDVQYSTDSSFTSSVVNGTDTASPTPLTGLAIGTQYYYRMRSKATGYTTSPWTTPISFTTTGGVANKVFFGNKGTGTNLTESQIEAGTQLAYSPGADISVLFNTNAPTFNWAAWPSQETGITNYFVNSLDFGGFGGGSPWNDLVTVGAYTFVINQYATQYPSPDPVIFKH